MPSFGLSDWIASAVRSCGVSTVATGFISALPFLPGSSALAISASPRRVCAGGVGILGLKGPWLAMISGSFSEATAAARSAPVSTLSNFSGFFAPWLMGLPMVRTPDYRTAVVTRDINARLGAILVLGWGQTDRRRVGGRASA